MNVPLVKMSQKWGQQGVIHRGSAKRFGVFVCNTKLWNQNRLIVKLSLIHHYSRPSNNRHLDVLSDFLTACCVYHPDIDWLVDSCSGLWFPLVLISSSEPLNKIVNLTLFSWTRLRGHKTPLACHHCMKQWLYIFHLSHDCELWKGEDVMMDWIRDKKKKLVLANAHIS